MKSGPNDQFRRIQGNNIDFDESTIATPLCKLGTYLLLEVENPTSREGVFIDLKDPSRKIKLPAIFNPYSVRPLLNRHFICLDEKKSIQEYTLEENVSGNLECKLVKTIVEPLPPPPSGFFRRFQATPPDNRHILSVSPNGEFIFFIDSHSKMKWPGAYLRRLYSRSTGGMLPLPVSKQHPAAWNDAYQFVSDSSFYRFVSGPFGEPFRDTSISPGTSALEFWRIHHNKPIRLGEYSVRYANSYQDIKLSMKGESLLLANQFGSTLVSINELSKNPRSDDAISNISHGPAIPCWVVDNSKDKVVLLDQDFQVKLIDFNADTPTGRKDDVLEQAPSREYYRFDLFNMGPHQVSVLLTNRNGTVTPKIFDFTNPKLFQLKINVTNATPLVSDLSSIVADYAGTEDLLTLEKETNLLKQGINLVLQDSSLSGTNRDVLRALQTGIENTSTVSDSTFFQRVLTDPRFQDNRLDERVLAIVDHAQMIARELLPSDRPAPRV